MGGKHHSFRASPVLGTNIPNLRLPSQTSGPPVSRKYNHHSQDSLMVNFPRFRLSPNQQVIIVGPILASSYDKVEANQISADGVGQNGGNANSVRPSAFLERE